MLRHVNNVSEESLVWDRNTKRIVRLLSLTFLQVNKCKTNQTCTCNGGQQTPDHLIYECKHLQAQRSSLIKHIMIRGGDWPPAHDELVTTYLTAFTRFIKSIDFQKPQQTIRDIVLSVISTQVVSSRQQFLKSKRTGNHLPKRNYKVY